MLCNLMVNQWFENNANDVKMQLKSDYHQFNDNYAKYITLFLQISLKVHIDHVTVTKLIVNANTLRATRLTTLSLD